MARSIQHRLRGFYSDIERAVGGKPKWRAKPGTFAAAVLLLFIALAQLLRVVFHVKTVVDGVMIPLWGSAIACVVAAILAVMLWRENRL